MFLPQEIIRSKRNGENLSLQQIQDFVSGLVTGDFSDAQVGSMAMAVYLQGMNTDEIVNLTMAMKTQVMYWLGLSLTVLLLINIQQVVLEIK